MADKAVTDFSKKDKDGFPITEVMPLTDDEETKRAERQKPTEESVSDEITRRLVAFAKAKDKAHFDQLRSQATGRAVHLLAILQERDWTADEQAESVALKQKQMFVEAHGVVSAQIRAMDPIPDNFSDLIDSMVQDIINAQSQ